MSYVSNAQCLGLDRNQVLYGRRESFEMYPVLVVSYAGNRLQYFFPLKS